MSKKSVRTVYSSDRMIQYVLEIKKVKNLNLRVKPDGVYVSANYRVPLKTIDAFVMSKADFIFSAQERIAKRGQNAGMKPKKYEAGEIFRFFGNEYPLLISESDAEDIRLTDEGLLFAARFPNDPAKTEKAVKQFIRSLCLSVFGDVMKEIYPIFEEMGVS